MIGYELDRAKVTPHHRSGATTVGIEIAVGTKKTGIANEHLTSQRWIKKKADSKPDKHTETRAVGVKMTAHKVNDGIRQNSSSRQQRWHLIDKRGQESHLASMELGLCTDSI